MSGLGSTTPHHPVAATRKPERPHETEPSMTLADKLDQTPRRNAGLPCSVGALLDDIGADEAAALERMMGELGWSAARIYEALRAEGHDVGRQTINRHRSRSCRCFQ